MSDGRDDLGRLQRFARVAVCPDCRRALDGDFGPGPTLVCSQCGTTVGVNAGVIVSRPPETDGWAAAITVDMDQKAATYVNKYDSRTRASRGFLIRRAHALDLAGTDPGRVLEAGCGPGVVSPLLAERDIETHGVDLSAGQLRTAAARDTLTLYAQGDLERLPYRDGMFDTVMLLGVLEYIDRPDRVVRELARVVAPGGRLIVTVPNASCPGRVWTQQVYLPISRSCKRALGHAVSSYSRTLYSARHLYRLLEGAGLERDESRFFEIVLAPSPAERLLASRNPRFADRLEEHLRGPLRHALSFQIITRARKADK
jgi:ubiquinone/menaquinone biosynthesis C-methylase UbiE